ncbi:MAG: hypothetical protein ACRENQ_13705, partial [Gemmatimonadaceae bacterium]
MCKLILTTLSIAVFPWVLAAQSASQLAVNDSSAFRPLVLPTPNDVRTASGRPGARYWQQKVDYTIAAALDPARNQITGRETIRYHNNSPATLRFVWLQVDQNIYRTDSRGSFINPSD